MSCMEMTDAASMLMGQRNPADRDVSVFVVKVLQMGSCSCMQKYCPQWAVWSGSVSYGFLVVG